MSNPTGDALAKAPRIRVIPETGEVQFVGPLDYTMPYHRAVRFAREVLNAAYEAETGQRHHNAYARQHLPPPTGG